MGSENRLPLRQALQLLADMLEFAGAPRYEIVVCGGAALNLTNLLNRATRDVDIIALRDEATGGLRSSNPFPEPLRAAAGVVAEELGLDADWLNDEPRGLYDMGLPQALADRLQAIEIGPHLTVHVIARVDQIHFKLYAAIDQPNSRHTTDLLALGPNSSELESAVRWAMTHDTSEGFRTVARHYLTQIGFPDVAGRL